LVAHPIIVDVFLTPFAPKPRFPKPAEAVPTHPRLVCTQLD
jgi:hypothetical protein